ncbi:MAG: VWA domain-containing protein [Meiothermus ruber]|nr:VWA domain-containing protein [Meiothermus ruber]
MPPNAFPYGNLLENLVAFGEHLRRTAQQFNVGPQEIQDSLRALEAVNLGNLQEVRQALKLVMCSSLEQERVFDDLFFQFFLSGRQRPAAPSHPPKATPGGPEEGHEQIPARRSSSPEHPEGSGDLTGKGQPHPHQDTPADWAAPLLKAMFSRIEGAEAPEVEIPQQDLEAMLQAATQMVNQVRLGRSRRWKLASKGPRFHLRRTLRKALHTGGDPLYPAWQHHPKRQPRFIFVLDGSRSMQDYADRLLQFAYALRMRCNRVEVFVFSTQMERITRQLEKAKSLSERPRLHRLGRAWGGGTSIGENLLRLEQQYGGLIRGDSIVIVASDGLDTGATEILELALQKIRQRSAALIWLNPLLNQKGYDPRANCMNTALPYLDRFCTAEDPETFARLTQRLRLRK